jgi:hypothetical protein
VSGLLEHLDDLAAELLQTLDRIATSLEAIAAELAEELGRRRQLDEEQA